jgi:uncharacterized protein
MTRILITGCGGLLGSALIPLLEARGHICTRLSHTFKHPQQLFWNIDSQQLPPSSIEGFDTIIHLAGENVGNGRWTKDKKEAIYNSRVLGTQLLCNSISKLKYPPTTFIVASASGYYGSQGSIELTESSSPGTTFLSNLCQKWEEASASLVPIGVRRVLLRFGVVLSLKGGALPKMLTPYKYYLGGKIGSGKQYISWISLRDAAQSINFLIESPAIEGPVNISSPNPITNAEFSKVLGKVLKRPSFFPFPAFIAKIMLGQMGKELLLSSARVTPSKLIEHKFPFRHSSLESALKDILLPV